MLDLMRCRWIAGAIVVGCLVTGCSGGSSDSGGGTPTTPVASTPIDTAPKTVAQVCASVQQIVSDDVPTNGDPTKAQYLDLAQRVTVLIPTSPALTHILLAQLSGTAAQAATSVGSDPAALAQAKVAFQQTLSQIPLTCP